MGNHIELKTNFCAVLEISYNYLKNREKIVEAAVIEPAGYASDLDLLRRHCVLWRKHFLRSGHACPALWTCISRFLV